MGSGSSGTTVVADPEQQRRLLREVQRRTDLVSYALLAEVNHFHRDQVHGQMAGHVRQLLRTQIEFYRKASDMYLIQLVLLKQLYKNVILFTRYFYQIKKLA